MKMLKIDYEELMQYYEVADNGEPGDGEYEDAVDAIVCRVPFIVKEHKELETENQTLQKQTQELEKALIELVKIEVRLPECAVCWERGQCTDRSHGDNCLAIGYIIDTAKEAAKEDK